MDTISYTIQNTGHTVCVGNRILLTMNSLIQTLYPNTDFVIVYDPNVPEYFVRDAQAALPGYIRKVVAFQAGESIKTLNGFKRLFDILIPIIDRSTCIVIIGGGTLGDLGGFVSSTILRGVPWLFIPTTFLAQIDSSIGGKTGINTRFGKNLIGSFYPPKLVISDSQILQSLDMPALKSGYGELLKHALIDDTSLFLRLVETIKAPQDLSIASNLDQHSVRSIQIKISVIGEDWHETGGRDSTRIMLNLGHTFGHGIESLSHFKIPHGIAVAHGIRLAYMYAVHINLISYSVANQVISYIDSIFGPIPPIQASVLYTTMMRDKKKQNDQIYLILPRGIGAGCGMHPLCLTVLNTVLNAKTLSSF